MARSSVDNKELVLALQAFIHWGDSLCPLLAWGIDEDNAPDPCPLCRATEAKGVCKSAESSIPAHILDGARAAIKNAEENHEKVGS